MAMWSQGICLLASWKCNLDLLRPSTCTKIFSIWLHEWIWRATTSRHVWYFHAFFNIDHAELQCKVLFIPGLLHLLSSGINTRAHACTHKLDPSRFLRGLAITAAICTITFATQAPECLYGMKTCHIATKEGMVVYRCRSSSLAILAKIDIALLRALAIVTLASQSTDSFSCSSARNSLCLASF